MLPYTIGDVCDELVTAAGLAEASTLVSASAVAFALTCTVFDEVASANKGTVCEPCSNCTEFDEAVLDREYVLLMVISSASGVEVFDANEEVVLLCSASNVGGNVDSDVVRAAAGELAESCWLVTVSVATVFHIVEVKAPRIGPVLLSETGPFQLVTVAVDSVLHTVDVKTSPGGGPVGFDPDSGQFVTVAVDTVLHSVALKIPGVGRPSVTELQSPMCSVNSAIFEAGTWS